MNVLMKTCIIENLEIINYLKSKKVISRINEVFPYKFKKRFSQVIIYFFYNIMHLLLQEAIKEYKVKFI